VDKVKATITVTRASIIGGLGSGRLASPVGHINIKQGRIIGGQVTRMAVYDIAISRLMM
jgi:bisphosphoglycerate-independent phosphoglycerate mutase (AlkP superfamily)